MCQLCRRLLDAGSNTNQKQRERKKLAARLFGTKKKKEQQQKTGANTDKQRNFFFLSLANEEEKVIEFGQNFYLCLFVLSTLSLFASNSNVSTSSSAIQHTHTQQGSINRLIEKSLITKHTEFKQVK